MSLSLVNLSKSFSHGVQAVRDVSLDVQEGELLVVLGPSGCGKTTLLRLIAGLEKPGAGSILMGGKRVNGVRPARRGVGFVFQQPVLYPHMTVEKNLRFVLRRSRLSSAEQQSRIDEVAELCRIEPLRRRKPGQLSIGEQQRVALARNVLRKPKCLLLDEPLASLDAPMRAQLRREFRRVHQAARLTSVFVTHDQQEAFTLGERVAVMNDGAIIEVATPTELYRQPGCVFTARFIGSPGMNFFDGHIESKDGQTVFVSGGSIRVPLQSAPRVEPMKKLVLGVRPEDVCVLAGDDTSADAFEAVISHCELLGDSALLTARTPSHQQLLLKSSARDIPQAGDSIHVRFNHDALHFFEPGPNGRRIASA